MPFVAAISSAAAVDNFATATVGFSIARAFGALPSTTMGNLVFSSLPSGAAGQLLIAQIGFRNSAVFAMPAGWTQIAQVSTADTTLGGQVSGLMAFKIRGASEPNPTFTRTGGGYAVGAVIGYTPSTGGFALDTSSTFAQASATTALAGAAITVANPNSLLVTIGVVAGQDDTLNANFSAAGLSKTPSPAGLVPLVANVDVATWGQSFWNRIVLGGVTGVTAMGFDVAGVTAGSTGAFSGTSVVSSRGLVIAAAFRRT